MLRGDAVVSCAAVDVGGGGESTAIGCVAGWWVVTESMNGRANDGGMQVAKEDS